MSENHVWYQHGDILIKPLPSGEGVPKGRQRAGQVLARGEATGHAHVARGDGAVVIEGEDDQLYLDAPKGATITHEEHKTISIPAGQYRIERVREYDHFAEEAEQTREVED